MAETTALKIQEEQSTKLLGEQKAEISIICNSEQRLKLSRSQAENVDDDEQADHLTKELKSLAKARRTLTEFADVVEFIAKSSKASRTGQKVGDVVIEGHGAVNMSNNGTSTADQRIGDVRIGSKGRGWVSVSNGDEARSGQDQSKDEWKNLIFGK